MNPFLVLCTVVGLSVEDLSEAGGPFLGIDELTFHRPVYPGDTLTARSEVISARESASQPAFGIVTWHTEGFNQHGELVIDYKRSNLARKRGGEVTTTASPYLTDERLEIQSSARRVRDGRGAPAGERARQAEGGHPATPSSSASASRATSGS